MTTSYTTISRSLIRGILFAAVLCLLFAGSAGAVPYLNIDVYSDILPEYPADAVFTFSSTESTDLKVNYGDGTAELSLDASSKTLSHTYNSPGTYTVWLNATSNGEKISTTKKVVVLPYRAGGTITITSDETSYYILEKFTLSGVNTYGDNVRVYIAGTNIDPTEVTGGAVSVVEGKWSVVVDTFDFMSSNNKKIDVGTYNFYVVSGEDRIQSLTELENKKYAYIQISLKQPQITITSSPSGVSTGSSVVFSGFAYGAEEIVYYIFNNEEMVTGTAFVSQVDYTYQIEVSTTGFESGDYRVVIQHPMYDKEFNVYPDSIGNGDYEFYLKPSNSQQSASVIFDTKERDFLRLAQALCDALNSQKIDDLHDDVTFIYLNPSDSNTGFISITNSGMNHVENEIYFDGVNTAADYVYLYLKTPAGTLTCLTENPILSKDMHWEVTTSLPRFTELGIYEFYAVSSDSSTSPAVSEITKGEYAVWEFENTVAASVVSDVAENPDVNAYVVAKNKEASIYGNTEDTLLVQYWILGTNYVDVGTVTTNSKGEFNIPIDTSNPNMSSGQYFVVIQHPGDDTVFNVGHLTVDNGNSYVVMNEGGSYNVPSYSVLFSLFDRQIQNACQALCDVFDNVNVDDTYTSLSFFVVNKDDSGGGTKPEPTEIYSNIVITPSGSLEAGQSVTGSLKMMIPGGLMGDNDKVTISSPLTNFKLNTDILRGGEIVVNDYQSSTISGFMLGSSSNLILEITFSGVVSEESKGKYINVIQIETTVPGFETYTSPKQPVAPLLEGYEVMNLNEGWNFISFPKYLDASCDTASELLGSLDTDGISPLGYDAKTGWYVLKADTRMKPLDGYWVYTKEDTDLPLKYSTAVNTPPSKSVYKGWNAVGLSAEKTMTAKSAFSNLEWVRCLSWDVEQSKWGTVIVNGGSSENSEELKLELGSGNWLYVEADGIYLGNTA